jgi:hypothetical protein
VGEWESVESGSEAGWGGTARGGEDAETNDGEAFAVTALPCGVSAGFYFDFGIGLNGRISASFV